MLAACFSGYDSPAHDALRVRRGDFQDSVILTGELDAARGSLISVPPIPSWQTAIKWLAPDGVEVQAGERVAELDNTSFTTDLESKRQTETQARQELQQKEAEWIADLRDKELDRDKKQAEFEKARLEAAVPPEILSVRDYQDRQVKYHRAEVEWKKADAVLASQRAGIADDRANLQLKLQRASREVAVAQAAIDTLVLRAPRAGIVVIKDHPWEQRKLDSGDTVWVGFPIAMIPDPSSLQVAAALADVDDGRVAIGMPADVTLDAYPDLHFGGKVTAISAVAQESKSGSLRRMFRVVVALDQIDRARMRPGLSARVAILRDSRHGVLLAPRAGIDFRSSGARARLEGGRLVPVQLGDCNAQDCIVTSGLNEGARLGS